MDLMKMNIKNVHRFKVTEKPTSTDRMSDHEDGFCCVKPAVLQRELTWVDLINRYRSPRECLAAFVVSSAAEVIAGVKPANLIRIVCRNLPCGRNMYQLWQDHGQELLCGSSLEVKILRSDADGVLLLFYRRELLEKRLAGRTMRSFLKRFGYPEPLTLNSALAHLSFSFQQRNTPDEVGVFLGYPIKDVNGFIARKSTPWSGRCMWRVYGPPQRSLRLYRCFCDERQAMTRRMMDGQGPAMLLQAS